MSIAPLRRVSSRALRAASRAAAASERSTVIAYRLEQLRAAHREAKGALINEVTANGPASAAGLKVQDISAQVAVRREDRVRVLQMPAEEGGAFYRELGFGAVS